MVVTGIKFRFPSPCTAILLSVNNTISSLDIQYVQHVKLKIDRMRWRKVSKIVYSMTCVLIQDYIARKHIQLVQNTSSPEHFRKENYIHKYS